MLLNSFFQTELSRKSVHCKNSFLDVIHRLEKYLVSFLYILVRSFQEAGINRVSIGVQVISIHIFSSLNFSNYKYRVQKIIFIKSFLVMKFAPIRFSEIKIVKKHLRVSVIFVYIMSKNPMWRTRFSAALFRFYC